jgi:FkbM family methyltransferase
VISLISVSASLEKRVLNPLLNATIKSRIVGSSLVYRIARRIVSAYENNDVNINSNGERWLQAVISTDIDLIAIDVGANQGEWVEGLLSRDTTIAVFCYEPVPKTFAKLVGNVKDNRAVLINKALSSKTDSLTMNSSTSNAHISSVYDNRLFDGNVISECITVFAVTGDDEINRLSLKKVSVLKIDAEGHDFDVLLGFHKAVQSGIIEIVQFEYNIFTLLAKRSLRDFFNLLSADYLLCKLLPSGLEACGYHPVLEDFRQSNWVALHINMIDEASVRRFSIRPASGLPGIALASKFERHPDLKALLKLRPSQVRVRM